MPTFFQRNRVLVLHLLFWCIYLSFIFYQISFYQRERGYDWDRALTFTAVQLAFTLTITYFNYFILLPRFLKSKRLWRYLIEFIIPFTILITIRIYLQRYMIAGSGREAYFNSTMYVVQVTAVTLFIVFFVGMLRFAVDWFELEAKKKAIENERLIAELNFLKAQINPHFLFNTLNNLYYLAYSKSDNTTEVIAKLSQMMRYMIYDSNYAQVLLSREIEYMQNYISLERIRLNNQIPITFDVEGDPDRVLISPLIFITFLENAFKHGVSNSYDGAWVKVSIKLNGKECVYTVENSKLPGTKPEAHEKSGIGLQNVKRRLELSYPDNYTLHVNDTTDRYKVQLNITLA
jgi:two-component system, LytTR family, sensor histidine kinase AlgZ